jgi:predicted MPP superfamily phosphohydrolase
LCNLRRLLENDHLMTMTAAPRQAVLFILGAIVLAFLTHFLIWRRLIVPANLPKAWHRPAFGVLLGLGVLFPAGMLQLLFFRYVPRTIAAPLMTAAFAWLGLVIFLCGAVAILEITSLFLPFASPRRSVFARLAMAAAFATATFSLVQANRRPEITVTQFAVKPELAGYRIVLLSDLHIGPSLGRSFTADVAHQVNGLNADLIVIDGDLVDGGVQALAPEVEPLRSLHAREGVVFIFGNHEYLSGVDAWTTHIQSFGWHILRNSRLSLARFDVIGLDDFSGSALDTFTLLLKRVGRNVEPSLSWALDQGKLRRPTVLVSHQPLALKDACRIGADLALAGHTHGGQIFPLGIWEWIQQGYLKGPYRCGNTQMYVTSGAGYWGPPMRLGSRNEISVIELVSAGDTR